MKTTDQAGLDAQPKTPVDTTRRRLTVAGIGGTLASPFMAAGNALASDSWPNQTIKIVVGYAPGGPTDTVARLLAAQLQERMGQSVIVENKPGGGSNIAARQMLQAASDGYTLMLGTIANATSMSVYRKPGYDIQKDFEPIGQLMSAPSVLVAWPGLGVNTLQDVIALARKKNGELTFGSSGAGGSPHLAGEMLQLRTGVKMTHVPYKGAGPALQDLIGGQIAIGFMTAVSSVPHVKAGKLKAIAVADDRRIASLPEVPTMAEAGMPDFEVSSWSGLFAPKGTPLAIRSKLSDAVKAIVAMPDFRARLLATGSDPIGSSPDEFRKYLAAEVAKWAGVAKAANLSL
jgi:tripartite-type tricarboxylate transporter receptor subunit TctC